MREQRTPDLLAPLWHRRHVLSILPSALISGMLARPLSAKNLPSQTRFATGFKDRTEATSSYGLALLSASGELIAETYIDDRLHAITASPQRQYPHLCAPTRRPGTKLYLFDQHTAQLRKILICPEGVHFQGHAAYHPTRPLLYTAENHYHTGQGMIGLWDVKENYRRLGAFPSGGIGPHEIKRHPTLPFLVVANGGLQTHPETGRSVLNKDIMSPNLSMIHLSDHHVKTQYRLPPHWHQNSIRHFDITPGGDIVIGLQYQGGRTDLVPLIAVIKIPDTSKASSHLTVLRAPPNIERRMRHYCGSVTILPDTSSALVSHPRGHFASLWDLGTNSYLGQIHEKDICGLSHTRDGFIATTGTGHVLIPAGSETQAAPLSFNRQQTRHRSWDNHLTRYPVASALDL